jgi:hypothetical protein
MTPIEQDKTKIETTTKTTGSASFKLTNKVRNKMISIKKDPKYFQANENISCLLNYYTENSVKEYGRICSHVFKIWCHELYVGAFRKKNFIRGKCI